MVLVVDECNTESGSNKPAMNVRAIHSSCAAIGCDRHAYSLLRMLPTSTTRTKNAQETSKNREL